MAGLNNNKIRSIIRPLADKLRFYAQEKPKMATALYGAVALITLLLISTLIALVTKEDPKPIATASRPDASITITKDGFVPATLVVKKGTKIVWKNLDQSMHQVQANPHPTGESLPGLKSAILNSTHTYEYVADTAGTFGYHDQLNPTTNGTLQVQE